MYRLLVVLVVVAATFFSGCATTPPVDEEAKAALRALKQEKIAVNYTVAQKRINLSEVLFRVLWLETKTSTKDFSGVWSADTDLTSYAAESLRMQGYQAESLRSVVGGSSIVDDYNAAWGKQVLENSLMDHPGHKGVKLIPRPEFFVRADSVAESDRIRTELKSKGYRYIVELTALDLYGNALGYGMVSIEAAPVIRLIDVNSGRSVWAMQLIHKEIYQLGGDLNLLESNQMGKTKEGLRAGISGLKFSDIFAAN